MLAVLENLFNKAQEKMGREPKSLRPENVHVTYLLTRVKYKTQVKYKNQDISDAMKLASSCLFVQHPKH